MASGLVAYGVYVPRHRLRHAELGAALGSRGGEGSRAIASYDEDATTMGVEAARRAVADGTPVPGLYFATTAPPYLDKTNATAIHAALDVGHDGFALGVAGSVRGATGALRAAAAGGGLAVLSDLRTGRPGSADERDGAAAAAFLFRRRGSDRGDRGRGIHHSGVPRPLARAGHAGQRAVGGALRRGDVPAPRPDRRRARARGRRRRVPDHVVISGPHARAVTAARKELPGRVPEEPPAIGYSGTADAGVRLAAVLDRADPGETILLVVAADGCDATVLRTTDALVTGRAAVPVAAAAAGGRDATYASYLTWRGLLEREQPRWPEPGGPPGRRPRARRRGSSPSSGRAATSARRCTSRRAGCASTAAPRTA